MKTLLIAMVGLCALANAAHAQDGRHYILNPAAMSLTIGARDSAQRRPHDTMSQPPGDCDVARDWWSISASIQPVAALKLLAGYADRERSHTRFSHVSGTAWVLGANYTLASGTLVLGYGHAAADNVLKSKQLSIGYAYPLSRHATLYADASHKKAEQSIRYYGIGLRTAY